MYIEDLTCNHNAAPLTISEGTQLTPFYISNSLEPQLHEIQISPAGRRLISGLFFFCDVNLQLICDHAT